MFFFKSRRAARTFARKTDRTVTDFGVNASRRWAVRVM